MKVLVIDPVRARVTEGEWDGKSLKPLYDWIKTDIVERTPGPHTIWVDEEGSMKKLPVWFCTLLYPQPLVGVGVLQVKKNSPSKEAIEKTIRWGLLFNPHGPVGGNA